MILYLTEADIPLPSASSESLGTGPDHAYAKRDTTACYWNTDYAQVGGAADDNYRTGLYDLIKRLTEDVSDLKKDNMKLKENMYTPFFCRFSTDK